MLCRLHAGALREQRLTPSLPRCPCPGYISAHLNPATCLALWVIGKVGACLARTTVQSSVRAAPLLRWCLPTFRLRGTLTAASVSA